MEVEEAGNAEGEMPRRPAAGSVTVGTNWQEGSLEAGGSAPLTAQKQGPCSERPQSQPRCQGAKLQDTQPQPQNFDGNAFYFLDEETEIKETKGLGLELGYCNSLLQPYVA